MTIGIHTNLFSLMTAKIQQSQMQLSYDMKIATPSVFHPEAASDREIEPSYYHIVCGRTKCEMEHQVLDASNDLERCG